MFSSDAPTTNEPSTSRKRKRSLISPESESEGAERSVRQKPPPRLPPTVLLLNFPKLVACPPNHRLHRQSLALSLSALRKCLSIARLPPDVECRACSAFAELGLKVVYAGLTQNRESPWAHGIEDEVSICFTLALPNERCLHHCREMHICAFICTL